MNAQKLRAILPILLFSSSLAWTQVAVLGSLTHEYDIAPGGSYEGSIDIHNPGDEAQEIKAYQNDYLFYANGSVNYAEPGEAPRSNARWMSLSPRQLIIPPKETVSLHYVIQVPADAALKGTYWSMVLVEPVPKGSPESSQPLVEPGVSLRQTVRYGVQIVTQVGDTGSRLIKFDQLKLVAENGKRSLIADVANVGETWLRGSFSLDLYSSTGAYIGKFEGGRKRMYPQTSVRYSTELAGLAQGNYKALIVVDCGGDDVFGVNVNLILKD